MVLTLGATFASRRLGEVDVHKRLPEIVGNLALGMRYFLNYTVETGAVSRDEAQAHAEASWDALCEAAKAQTHLRKENNPAERFIALLSTAISSGRAHLATEKGDK